MTDCMGRIAENPPFNLPPLTHIMHNSTAQYQILCVSHSSALQAPYILIPGGSSSGGNGQNGVSVPQNADGTSTVTPPASGTVRECIYPQSGISYVSEITLISCQKARCVCTHKLHVKAASLTACWTRQIRARPSQPWVWLFYFIPAPASRDL